MFLLVEILGIWFNNPEKCEKVGEKITRYQLWATCSLAQAVKLMIVLIFRLYLPTPPPQSKVKCGIQTYFLPFKSNPCLSMTVMPDFQPCHWHFYLLFADWITKKKAPWFAVVNVVLLTTSVLCLCPFFSRLRRKKMVAVFCNYLLMHKKNMMRRIRYWVLLSLKIHQFGKVKWL